MRKLIRVAFALLLVWCGFTEAIQWFALLFFNMWVAGDLSIRRAGLTGCRMLPGLI